MGEWFTLARHDGHNLPLRGRPFTLEVRVQGQQIRGSLDGIALVEAHDVFYVPGFIGLGVRTDYASGPVAVQWQSAEVRHEYPLGQQPVPRGVLNGWVAYDPRIRSALELLWVHNVSDWRSLYGWPLANQRTEIVWGNIPAGGWYEHQHNRIVINESYQHEPLSALAKVLAHEIRHAIYWPDVLDHSGLHSFAAECLEEEMLAFAWGAAAWEPFRPALAWSRSDDTWTAGELFGERLYQAWQDGALREFVLTSEGYQLQCLGRVLPDF